MKYIITGSLGNISKPITEQLVEEGHSVVVITSQENKKAEIEKLGATAAVGSVEDLSFLTKTFKGVDAVYTMVPPNFGAKDWKGYIGSIGKNYAEALAVNKIKHVVNLSSIGAHMPDGCGPVSGLYKVEKEFEALKDTNVKHLRAAFFYSNFYGNISMIKHMNIIGGNYGEGTTLVLVHPRDIAEAALEELRSLSFTGKSIRYVAGDEKSTNEIAATLGKSIQKIDLKWVDFQDEQTHGALIQAGLPEEIAKNYTEMGRALRTGEMAADYLLNKPTLSRIKLEDFAKEFAVAFNQN